MDRIKTDHFVLLSGDVVTEVGQPLGCCTQEPAPRLLRHIATPQNAGGCRMNGCRMNEYPWAVRMRHSMSTCRCVLGPLSHSFCTSAFGAQALHRRPGYGSFLHSQPASPSPPPSLRPVQVCLRAQILQHHLTNAAVTALFARRKVLPSSETKPGKAPRNVDYVGGCSGECVPLG